MHVTSVFFFRGPPQDREIKFKSSIPPPSLLSDTFHFVPLVFAGGSFTHRRRRQVFALYSGYFRGRSLHRPSPIPSRAFHTFARTFPRHGVHARRVPLASRCAPPPPDRVSGATGLGRNHRGGPTDSARS